MNKTRMFSVLVLAVLFCSVVSFRAIPVTVAQAEPQVLIYMRYADTSAPDTEYDQTLDAIDSSFGEDYDIQAFSDYTHLADHITSKTHLLIMEMENAPDISIMETIGEAWATDLYSFVNLGGTVISLDYASLAGGYYGPNMYLLNATGLMTILNYEDYYPGISTVSIVAPTDSLAAGVSSTITASSGTISVNSPEGTVVATDESSNPVVIHKTLGLGHVVYCGFDFFEANTEYAQILGNAIALTPSSPPGIPGFPVEAIAFGLIMCLGLGVVLRRRREVN